MAEVNAKQYKAIELKYEGESYQAIGKAIRVPLDTIKGWFESGGILSQYYENYTTNMNNLRKKTAERSLVRNVVTASTMLVALMGSEKDEIKFRAAKEILDRVIGEPKSQEEIKEDDKSPVERMSYEQRLRWAREQTQKWREETLTILKRLEDHIGNRGHANDKSVQETLTEIRAKINE